MALKCGVTLGERCHSWPCLGQGSSCPPCSAHSSRAQLWILFLSRWWWQPSVLRERRELPKIGESGGKGGNMTAASVQSLGESQMSPPCLHGTPCGARDGNLGSFTPLHHFHSPKSNGFKCLKNHKCLNPCPVRPITATMHRAQRVKSPTSLAPARAPMRAMLLFAPRAWAKHAVMGSSHQQKGRRILAGSVRSPPFTSLRDRLVSPSSEGE